MTQIPQSMTTVLSFPAVRDCALHLKTCIERLIPLVPAWKAQFGYECVSAVIQNTQIARVPKYSTIIELDRKVRDMELPKYAQQAPIEGAGLAEAMKYYMPLNYRNFSESLVLLQIPDS